MELVETDKNKFLECGHCKKKFSTSVILQDYAYQLWDHIRDCSKRTTQNDYQFLCPCSEEVRVLTTHHFPSDAIRHIFCSCKYFKFNFPNPLLKQLFEDSRNKKRGKPASVNTGHPVVPTTPPRASQSTPSSPSPATISSPSSCTIAELESKYSQLKSELNLKKVKINLLVENYRLLESKCNFLIEELGIQEQKVQKQIADAVTNIQTTLRAIAPDWRFEEEAEAGSRQFNLAYVERMVTGVVTHYKNSTSELLSTLHQKHRTEIASYNQQIQEMRCKISSYRQVVSFLHLQLKKNADRIRVPQQLLILLDRAKEGYSDITPVTSGIEDWITALVEAPRGSSDEYQSSSQSSTSSFSTCDDEDDDHRLVNDASALDDADEIMRSIENRSKTPTEKERNASKRSSMESYSSRRQRARKQ